MTIDQAVTADLANNSCEKREKFEKTFRTDDLSNIEKGDEFVMPESYTVIRRYMTKPDGTRRMWNEKPVFAEYIKVQTTTGKIVNFFPSSLTKTAFRVDSKTGKDVIGADRIVRTKGGLANWCRLEPDIDKVLHSLAGCTIKCEDIDPVTVRNFGVTNAQAGPEDVSERPNNIGTWILTGEKRPEKWDRTIFG